MKLLVIGGTRFVGRHIVTEALRRKHEVTLFNRGNNRELFPEVRWLQGDRSNNVDSLKGQHFDAVIDTCGYTPEQLELTSQRLQGTHYTFISTISVYAEPLMPLATEDAPLAELKEPTTTVSNESYGPLKVLCEKHIQEVFPQSLILRPGIVVGPYDPTDRFSYWVWRVPQSGTMLAPAPINAPLQFIDARDLAIFTLDSLEASLSGIFNVVTPAQSLCFGDLLEKTLEITKATTRITWVSEAFLETQNVSLPMWVPEAYQSWWQIASDRAIQAGLSFRNLEHTISDTLSWLSKIQAYSPKAGLTLDQEQGLLEAWSRHE